MDKYKIIDINDKTFGRVVSLGNKNQGVQCFAIVYGMPDIRIGDNFYILKDRFDVEFAYICNDNLWLRYIPATVSIDSFADNFKSLSDFSLDRMRYQRALKRSIEKMGIKSTNNAASNLRLWMSKNRVR